MTTTVGNANRPVRSSPLEAVHARLMARWRADGARWPLDYGNPSAEAAAAQSAAGLIDRGPLDKLIVQGPGAAGALRGASLGFHPGRISYALINGPKLQVWGVAPDEAIILSAPGVKVPDLTGPQGVAVVNLSSSFSVLMLIGPDARGILAELCPADLGPVAVPDLQIVHTPVANVRVTLARQDMGAVPAFTVLAPRDYASYLWESVMHAGAPFGLVPVGNHLAGEA